MDGTEVGPYDFLLMMWAPLSEGFEIVVPHYNSELALLGNEWWEALPEKKKKSENRKIALAKQLMARPQDPAAWQKRCILACEIARQNTKHPQTPQRPFESMNDLHHYVHNSGERDKPPIFSMRISPLYQAAEAAMNGEPVKCGSHAADTLTRHIERYKRLREILDVWCEI
jgi:hypothetical protein